MRLYKLIVAVALDVASLRNSRNFVGPEESELYNKSIFILFYAYYVIIYKKINAYCGNNLVWHMLALHDILSIIG